MFLGLLCGRIAASLLADPFSNWMFNCSRKDIDSTVQYRLFVLILAAVGGAIGVLFSRSRKRTAYLFSLATLVAIAVFAALEVPWSDLYCWAFLPTERDAEQAIRQAITKRNQPISLVSLHKTDGQESVIDGVTHYRLEYDAEWEITKDCDWKDARWYGWDVVVDYQGRGYGYYVPNEQAEKGDRVRTFGRIGFQKTKEGWRPEE